MRALTVVGPSIASGSHVWSGSWADLATAPPSRPSATRLTSQWFDARPRERARPFLPEADQQVGGEADEPPAREQEQQVPALDEEQHREDEDRHVGEVAALLVVAVHVADRVRDDEEADPGDDQHHHRRERVDEDA